MEPTTREAPCSLCIPDATGHTEVRWDPDDVEGTAIAREAFARARRKGMRAYRLDKRGERGEEVTDFDPQARQLVMVAPLVGG